MYPCFCEGEEVRVEWIKFDFWSFLELIFHVKISLSNVCLSELIKLNFSWLIALKSCRELGDASMILSMKNPCFTEGLNLPFQNS